MTIFFNLTSNVAQKLVFILMITLWGFNVDAQDLGYEEIGAQNGFTNAEVKVIFQDSKSNIWFGTYGSGLFKYNGISFERFTMADGLASNNVFSVGEGSDGEILIGCDDYRFSIFVNHKIETVIVKDSEVTGKYRCTEILPHYEKNKRLVVGLNNRMYLYQRGSLTLFPKHIDSLNTVNSIVRSAAINSEYAWIGLDRNLHIIEPISQRVVSKITSESGSPDLFNDIYINSKNKAYVASNSGFGFIENPEKPRYVKIDSSRFFFQIFHHQNRLYTCTNQGIRVYENDELVETLFPNKVITKMLIDNQNNIWAYVFSQGLIKVPNRYFVHYFKEQGEIYQFTLNDSFPSYLALRNDGVYKTLDEKNLKKASDSPFTFQMSYHPKKNELWYLDQTNQDIRIIRYENNRINESTIKTGVFHTLNCFSSTASTTLIGTWSSGIYELNERTRQIDRNYNKGNSGIGDNWIKDIYPYENEFLIGTHSGFNIYADQKMKNVLLPEEIGSYAFEKLVMDHKKNIWTLTSNGILVIEMNWKTDKLWDAEVIHTFHVRPRALTNSTDINDILIHDEICFIATSSGLFTIDLGVFYEEGRYHIQNFGISEGLYDANVLQLDKTPSGDIWFSTPSCITRFNYLNEPQKRKDLPLFIDNITVSNYDKDLRQNYSPSINSLSLPYNENTIFFSFRAVNLKSPSKVKYRYRLIGLSDKWSGEDSENEVLYTSLNPGSYEFQFNAKNESGRWNSEIKTFTFEIKPPYWQTTWFYILAIIGVLILVLLIVRLRLRNLQRQQKVLQQLVAEKTSVIEQERNKLLETNEELKIAKQRAEASEQSKERFFANMSHEIRTPLNAISGITNLMLQHEVSKKQEKHLNIIRHSSTNLMTIINDILDLTRLKEQKLRIEHINFSLDKVLSDISNLFEHKFKRQKNQFSIRLEPEASYYLKGDPLRLSQILINLIGNANKFTEKGRVDLIIQIETVSETEYRILFEVKDTGIGIDKEKHDSIFASFNQENPETSRLYGGTGLGLAITKELVELMNGTIKLKSKLGVGSSFTFELPFGRATCNALPDRTDETNEQQPIKTAFRVLLIEDNRYNQIVAEETLMTYAPNAEVTLADNGLKALEILNSRADFDIILMDLFMPEMDGYETTKQIRSSPNKSIAKIPIIALTANVSNAEKTRCENLGMNAYLVKPFNIDELIQLILDLTGKENDPLDVLKTLTGNQPDKTQKYIRMFLEMAPEEFVLLKNAIEEGDFETIKQGAHKLKTKTEMMGAMALLQFITTIEDLAMRKTNLSEIEKLMGKAEKMFNDLIEELTQQLKD